MLSIQVAQDCYKWRLTKYGFINPNYKTYNEPIHKQASVDEATARLDQNNLR